ncbi:MAG: deoxyribose-phosphate aldolase [Acholeplasmataceae bacterium]
MQINKLIDHTKLGANIPKAAIDQLVLEARTYDFKSVCVNPIWVAYVKEALVGSEVLTCTVIGFPHGTSTPAVKAFETKEAIKDGADEIDMVINVSALKEGDLDTVYEDISGVVKAASSHTVKVIIETCYLTKEEIVAACQVAVRAHADFVKTSTGFGTGGATVEHVKLMKDTVKTNAEVKASGGVRTYEQAMQMVDAGATRIGTSNGIDIVKNKRSETHDTNTSY